MILKTRGANRVVEGGLLFGKPLTLALVWTRPGERDAAHVLGELEERQ
jgi:hypothetical protein